MKAYFEADPRIEKAKKLLMEVVASRQTKIIAPKAPDSNLIKSYRSVIDNLGKLRGSRLWFPYIGSGVGNGALVELLDGSVKYDLICGIGVHNFGHSHREIISASIDAALSDIVMQGNLQQNEDTLELFELLLKESGFDHCFLTTSGAMANENALKIAFQKRFPAFRILAFEGNFAGRTLTMSQITEKAEIKEGLPRNIYVDYIPFFDQRDPLRSKDRALKTLKSLLKRNPREYAAMIFELIQGEGGYYPGSTSFFKPIMETLKDNGICVIVDEVQTFGRTSRLFAFQHFALEKLTDIVTIGKMAHVSATLFNKNYAPRPGLLSQTFTSSSAAIRVAKTLVKLMIKDNFFGPDGKNMRLNNHFVRNFKAISNKNGPLIKGPYGLGSMVAFTPFEGARERTIKFCEELFHNGVMSFICGRNPMRIRFLPPVGAINENDIDEVTKIVEKTLLCM